ncbi:MAG TPA: hypothetical protein VGG03_19535 [Thermoanaerobaculia bacterium]|jgi:hypothetical protein
MFKDRLAPAALVLAMLVVLSPAPSQAAPWSWTTASGPAAASLFTKIERWWDLVLSRSEQPARTREKQGCAIDPNGQLQCGTGSGTVGSTAPAPAAPSDSR